MQSDARPTDDAWNRRRSRSCCPKTPWTRRTILRALVAGWLAFCQGSRGQEASTPEERAARIKAAYLFQLLGYVDWPAESFPQNDSPFVVGVWGASPVTSVLETIAKSKQVKGRRISCVAFKPGDDPTVFHLLFVAANSADDWRNGLERIPANLPILIVGENRESFDHGAVISLIEADNKVRLHLSLATARSRQLRVSSRLSSVSTVID